MQDNNKQSKDISIKQSSKNQNNNQNQNDKKADGNNIKKESFFNECKQEFKKITWPTKPVLAKHTITVIVFSLVIGSITFVYDFGINSFFSKLAEFVS